MIKNIIAYLKNVDKLTYKIMKKGFAFCLILGVFSLFIILLGSSVDSFYIGLLLFKLSCYFFVEFIICGLAVDTIKKQII